jgi:hypothetical protein
MSFLVASEAIYRGAQELFCDPPMNKSAGSAWKFTPARFADGWSEKRFLQRK